MKRIILQVIMTLIGAAVGSSLLPYLWSALHQTKLENNNALNSLIGAIIFLLLSIIFNKALMGMIKKLDEEISKINLPHVGFSFLGGVLGLLIGSLASIALWALNIPVVSNVGPFLIMLLSTYVGYTLFSRRDKDIMTLFTRRKSIITDDKTLVKEVYKLLDTSVIIDGRILDILKTGFLDGVILIPNFVVHELQLIADSNDRLKRAKGRRGLDLVNDIKKLKNVRIEMTDKDYSDIHEVDSKLLRLATELDGSLVTNDYNLNKVAEIQQVPVLNINELANAVKPQVVVGETFDVTIVKKGSERHQGIGYMPDGTMIVVEDTDNMLDQTVKAEVTSSLQTNAGRMIFAKLVGA